MVDYAQIAAKKIRKPGQRPPRILIYGRNKQGKTTLASSAPGKTLLVDPESGAEFVTNKNVDIWPVSSWADINEVYQYLRSGNHTYEWVVLDGLTRISNMSLRYVMQQQEDRDLDRIPGMVQQRDYGKSGELMKGMLFNFHALPLGVVYTAQDRMETGSFDDSEDEDAEQSDARFVPDLPKGVRSSVNAIVDCIGRVYTVKIEHPQTGKMVVQRRLHIGPTEKYDTGYRAKTKLPDYIKGPTIPKLIELLKKEK